MLELMEQSRMAIDELIEVMGRASIEAVLELSARQEAGPPQQGKARQADIGWDGAQPGRGCLKDRKRRVHKPRLRRKCRGAGTLRSLCARHLCTGCWLPNTVLIAARKAF